MKQPAIVVVLLCGLVFKASAATPIAQWTFEGGSTSPTMGVGSASLVGGTSGTFGDGNLGGTGWFTSSYPVQGTANGSAGVQFNVSTAGFDLIEISYDHLASATASRWSEFQYTLDSTASTPVWVSYANNNGDLSPQDTFTTQTLDLSSVAGVADNPNFAFRIVSVFSPEAFNPGSPVFAYGAFSAYHRAHPDSLNGQPYGSEGIWAFDNISVGTLAVLVPEPSTGMLLLGGLGLLLLRRTKGTSP